MPVEMEQTNVQLHAVQLDARFDSGAVRNYVATRRLINCIIGGWRNSDRSWTNNDLRPKNYAISGKIER